MFALVRIESMNYKVLMIIVLLVSSGASAQNESPKESQSIIAY